MLTGRRELVEKLSARVAAGTATVISGPAGAGKTALLRELARQSGRRSLFGGGLAQLVWEPYLPLMRALGVRMRGGDPATVARFLATVVDDGLLVLDDLQFADDGTLAVLSAVAGQIAFVGAIRSGERLSAAARRVCERSGMSVVELDRLTREASLELLLARNPQLDATQAASIADAAAGNPLFLEQLAATGRPTRTLRLAIDARLAALSDVARLALATVALRGEPCERTALGEDAVDELVEAGLAERRGQRLALLQPLIGEQVLAALDADARKRLHERLANALTDPGERSRHEAGAGLRARASDSALQAADLAASPLRRASHLALAAACSDGDAAAALRVAAAADWLVAGEPVKARSLVDSVPSDTEHAPRARLLGARAALQLGDAVGAAREAAEGLRDERLDVGEQLALQIELLRADGGSIAPHARLDETRACVESARVLGEHQARALLVVGQVELQLGEDAWTDTLLEAVAEARRTNDIEVALLAGQAFVVGSLGLGIHESLLERAGEFEQLARESLLRGWELQFVIARLWLELVVEGRCDDVRAEAQALLADRAAVRQRDQLEALRALALADSGALTDADERLAEALRRAPGPGRGLLAWVDAETAWIARRQDALPRAEACIEAHGRERPVGALAAVTAAWAAHDAGHELREGTEIVLDYGGARSEHTGLRALRCAPGDAYSKLQAATVGWHHVQLRAERRCAWASAEALRLAGDTERARTELRELETGVSDTELRALATRIRRSRLDLGDRPAERRNADHRGLTQREHSIMRLAVSGYTNARIAEQLDIARATVEVHLDHVKEKLGAATKTEAIVRYADG
jgi:DNA-binding CsgD family transcriptional regulator